MIDAWVADDDDESSQSIIIYHAHMIRLRYDFFYEYFVNASLVTSLMMIIY